MRKLLKYEMRAMNRRLFPVYIGMLAIALLNYLFGFGLVLRGSNSLTTEFLESMPQPLFVIVSVIQITITALFFGLMVGMMVVWLMTTINRFRKGLLGREGYLMFTLPVTTGRLVGAKLLAASIHLLLSCTVAVLSFCILMGIPELFRLFADVNWFTALRDLTRAMPTWPLLILESLVLFLLSAFKSILLFYLAMALGHLSNRHRTLLSVVAYIGITTVLSMLAAFFFSGLAMFDAVGLLSKISLFFETQPHLSAHVSLIAAVLATLLQCAIFWFPTLYILNRRLNLE